MVIEQIATLIGTSILSIVSWVIANKSIFPLISNWWKEKKKDDLEHKSTLQAVEQQGYNVYEGQVKFLVQQIDSLQSIIKTKSEELTEVYKRLTDLRMRVQELEIELLRANENIVVYKDNCCMKLECPLRVPCGTVDKMLEKVEELNEVKDE